MHTDVESRAARGYRRPAAERRMPARRHRGSMWLSDTRMNGALETLIYAHGDGTMTLITETAPPLHWHTALEWSDADGRVRIVHGTISDTGRTQRTGERGASLFISRFVTSPPCSRAE